ncbi:MAG: hypothetical protein L3J96_00460, partial [Thermoplasmata archaeon]|nr:hypothetical protein [Thermoplasmata archaeon]
EQEVAEKFLHTAEAMLGASRRYELQQLAEEVHVRLLEARSDRNAALRARERGVPLAQRMRALTIELSHQLGIAAILIERAADARVAGALKRAREITELLHLLPPSSSLLRLWVLEGRYDALTNAPEAARDRWEAIIDLPANALSPRVRAESLLRLSILEASSGKEEVAREYLGRLSEPEVAAAMRPEWREWERQVRRRTGLDPEENAEAPASAS